MQSILKNTLLLITLIFSTVLGQLNQTPPALNLRNAALPSEYNNDLYAKMRTAPGIQSWCSIMNVLKMRLNF